MLRIMVVSLVALVLPQAASAAFQVQCVNPGLCSEKVCVANRAEAGMACQTQCGNHGKPKGIKRSDCTPG